MLVYPCRVQHCVHKTITQAECVFAVFVWAIVSRAHNCVFVVAHVLANFICICGRFESGYPEPLNVFCFAPSPPQPRCPKGACARVHGLGQAWTAGVISISQEIGRYFFENHENVAEIKMRHSCANVYVRYFHCWTYFCAWIDCFLSQTRQALGIFNNGLDLKAVWASFSPTFKHR